jgi:TrpR-related protein YerC/YecD
MRSKLSTNKRKELVLGLCRAIATLKSPQEVAEAITDLLTPKEVETIAKRLQIAQYLIDGEDYETIRSELKVGYSTIARVNTWLALSGKGYQIMLTRRKKSPRPKSEEEIYDPYSWYNIKRRYSMYFWPQLLLEELVRNADKKEKQKIKKALDKLEVKGRRFTGKFNKELYEAFSHQLLSSK